MLVIICYNYFGMYLVKYYHQEVCMGPSVNQDCCYLINAHVIENILGTFNSNLILRRDTFFPQVEYFSHDTS